MSFRRGTTLAALVLTGGLILPSAPAHAVVDPQIPLTAFGSPELVALGTGYGQTTVAIPIPSGVAPTMLRGQLQVPAEFTDVTIEVYEGNRLLSATDVAPAEGIADVELPLAGLRDQGDTAFIQLRPVPTRDEVGWCIGDDAPDLQLINAVVDYSGEMTEPSTIAEFLPPVLGALWIHVPDDPSAEVQTAALNLATAITSRYGQQRVEVRIVSLSTPASPAPFERSVFLSPEGESGVELREPGTETAHLEVSGDDMDDQVRLLTSQLLPLAEADGARAENLRIIPELGREHLTFAELGATQLSSESVARTRVTVGIEEARFAGFNDELHVRLGGQYSSLPPGTAGQIRILVGDQVVDSFSAEPTGDIDRTFVIPSDLRGRYEELAVELRTTGEVNCATTQPVSIDLDPESSVSIAGSGDLANAGFEVLPQAFNPDVDVALGDSTIDELRRAATILTAIQDLGSVRLAPRLVEWEDAVNSERPTLFIDSAGTRSQELPLHLERDGAKLSLTDESVSLPEAAPDASLQAAWDAENSRMIVAATSSGDPRGVDKLVEWLNADPARWNALTGHALVQMDSAEPVMLSAATEVSESNPSPFRWWVGILALAVAAGLLAALLTYVARRSGRH